MDFPALARVVVRLNQGSFHFASMVQIKVDSVSLEARKDRPQPSQDEFQIAKTSRRPGYSQDLHCFIEWPYFSEVPKS